jgi:hypothetical protein
MISMTGLKSPSNVHSTLAPTAAGGVFTLVDHQPAIGSGSVSAAQTGPISESMSTT